MENPRFYLTLLVILLSIFFLQQYILIPALVDPVAASLRKRDITHYSLSQEATTVPLKQFTVIIVAFDEPLLNKTVNNVLENTPAHLLREVLIIDDLSTVPVAGWENEPKVRIIRTQRNLGLINARILGGNEARGDFIAFIDAHVFVSPRWLNTPFKYLSEDPKTIVNFVNFKLDPDTFIPSSPYAGIGSSASFSWSLGIFWGGGSKHDDYSPITMGMFSTSKYWWKRGAMDNGLGRWGGENIEISLRTWLCGGRIRVAKDSYVAHAFRSRFPYKVSMDDINRNNLRVASVWLDGEYLQKYYQAAHIALKEDGLPKLEIGDISRRLALKEQLHCKPFSWYVEYFKGRAPCSPGEGCGSVSTVDVNSMHHFNLTEAFYVK